VAPSRRGPGRGRAAVDPPLADPDHAPVRAPIFSVELLGDATQVTVKAGGAMIAARGPKDFDAEIGTVVGLTSPGRRFYLFDRIGEGRIDRGPAATRAAA
jgi:multiple sugar transport system ATP-binding protein